MQRTYQLTLYTALLIAAANLVACGQRGPLYIPDQENQNEQNHNNEQKRQQKG